MATKGHSRNALYVQPELTSTNSSPNCLLSGPRKFHLWFTPVAFPFYRIYDVLRQSWRLVSVESTKNHGSEKAGVGGSTLRPWPPCFQQLTAYSLDYVWPSRETSTREPVNTKLHPGFGVRIHEYESHEGVSVDLSL